MLICCILPLKCWQNLETCKTRGCFIWVFSVQFYKSYCCNLFKLIATRTRCWQCSIFRDILFKVITGSIYYEKRYYCNVTAAHLCSYNIKQITNVEKLAVMVIREVDKADIFYFQCVFREKMNKDSTKHCRPSTSYYLKV